jgi:hypothetical protein
VEAHLWERNGFTGSPKTELSAKILEETVWSLPSTYREITVPNIHKSKPSSSCQVKRIHYLNIYVTSLCNRMSVSLLRWRHLNPVGSESGTFHLEYICSLWSDLKALYQEGTREFQDVSLQNIARFPLFSLNRNMTWDAAGSCYNLVGIQQRLLTFYDKADILGKNTCDHTVTHFLSHRLDSG